MSYIQTIKYQIQEVLSAVYDPDTKSLKTNNQSSSSDPDITIINGYSDISDNRKVVTTSGTAVALAASTLCKEIIITAEVDNTGVIVVGGSSVVAALATRRGIPLSPGDSISISIDNLADVYIDSTVSGDGVTFLYLT